MTQDECSAKWEALRRSTIDAITEIDAETPGKPVDEPKWWAQMMEARRLLIKIDPRKPF